jgi:putative transposase
LDNQCFKDINEFLKKTVGGSIEVCHSFIETAQSKHQKVRVCRLWGIHSNSSIYKKPQVEMMGHYFKQTDDEIFELIKPIIQARPTYGYKRVTAMLNRQLQELGLTRYNKNRVYRIMKLKGAILSKTKRIRDHKATVVMTIYSKTRWYSGGLEIECFNVEKVYIVFVLGFSD